MNTLAYHENESRGTFDFPIEFYYIDSAHTRYQMPLHWHLDYELILILSGNFQLSLDSHTITLKTGDCALISSGILHGGIPDDCIYECIVFDFDRFLRKNPISTSLHISILELAVRQQYFFEKESKGSFLINQIFETMGNEQQGYEFITIGLLWQLFGTLIKQQLVIPEITLSQKTKFIYQIKKVLNFIYLDYAEPLTLADLAKEAGMSPKYFCRAFYGITGRTPVDYLNYYRIECAGERLYKSNESVTDIALSCGFNDLSYFSKTFKKYKGISAHQYRKNQNM